MKTKIFKKNLKKATEICEEIMDSKYLKEILETFIWQSLFPESTIREMKSSPLKHSEYKDGVLSFLDDCFIEHLKKGIPLFLDEWLYDLNDENGADICPKHNEMHPFMLWHLLIPKVIMFSLLNYNEFFCKTHDNLFQKVRSVSVDGLKRDKQYCIGCEHLKNITCSNYDPNILCQNAAERYILIQILKSIDSVPKDCPRLGNLKNNRLVT